MARRDFSHHLERVDDLIQQFDAFAPIDQRGTAIFRAELAGLLVVSMAASYENCIKEILVSHAHGKHVDFHFFIERNYARLNSRIKVKDLKGYCRLFHDDINDKFRASLTEKKAGLTARTGQNIETCYERILDWRHDYAHAGIKNTSIEEATIFHAYAKRVIYCFDQAFS